MSDTFNKYDDVLSSILVNEKSILGFLSTVFNFLARRTDFYYVPEGPYENIGFPPGVAEELVIKVLRKCDPKSFVPNGIHKPQLNSDLNNDIMCSTVAQEVEVIADNDDEAETIEEENRANNPVENPATSSNVVIENKESKDSNTSKSMLDTYVPPTIPTQKNSETYNGAERDKYCWAQTIMDLDIIIRLPPGVKSSKDLRVTINAGDINVTQCNGDVIIKDGLPFKIKAGDSFWSISEGKLLIHLEKNQERWWDKFLNGEESIDLSKIDCSRPLDELPEDHIAKVRELQWNQERKFKGLPTSDHIRNMDVLKKAWNAPGSPFKGQEFDPNILNQPSLSSIPPP